jgi:predicted phosphodiesterase
VVFYFLKGETMNKLIVSDFHIGDAKSKHLLFYSFLERHPEIDSLIIAGDLFDLWVTNAGRSFKEAKYLLDYLYERFRDKIIYLYGNHDEDIKYVTSLHGIEIKQYYIFEVAGYRTIVFHGHQYDHNFYLEKTELLAKVNAWLVNKVDHFFQVDIRKFLVSLSEKTKDDVYDKIIATYEYHLRKEFENKYDIIVTGHTHLYPYIKKLSNLYLINVGNNIQNATGLLVSSDEFSLIDYEDQSIKIIERLKINGGEEKEAIY